LVHASPTIKGCLDALCIPRNDQVRQQRQGARNRDHFVAAPSALRRERDLAGIVEALLQSDAVAHTQCGRALLQPYQHFRRVSTRYDKLADSYLVLASLACAFGPFVKM